ncbi:MAG: type I restriction-modification system subunit M [Chloroflexi bacterium]|nr:type I restriction-modification system subunit M [Chloroflexota bacterium]MBU1748730.1 type I restriction-modification system subunit M [Chloroflexota bacterium]
MVNNFGEKANFIWSIANLIRDTFKRGRHQDVILPFTVLRRVDQVLEPTKDQVLETHHRYKDRLDVPPDQLLRKASGYAFYNTSPYTFERLLADPASLADNLRAYIAGFSPNMREVVEKFDFDNTISRLDEAGLLFLVMERFRAIDLHPDRVPNEEMGYVFEELIRKFNESLNENPGEHFTPREVIRLMVGLLISPDQQALSTPHIVRTVADPCCGSGGMLIITKDTIQEFNPTADIYLFGQEVNPETYAICKSDLYMKSADGRDAENIQFGSTLSNDQHAGQRFDYQLANPPYGKDWKMDGEAVTREAERGTAGRFGAGTPRISDGQLLFLQHMLNRMQPSNRGGGRVAIVMNGSPLFTGDAGSGESEIRRWILEKDWLEAIVALPEQLFYNTGIATYVWVLSNRKQAHRQGKVQLIDATDLWVPMRKSLGDKRREIGPAHIAQVVVVYEAFEESERSRIFATTDLGYRKVTVERPLRLNFQASPERLARLKEERAFQNLAQSRKRDKAAKAQEEAAGREQQQAILAMLEMLPGTLYTDRREFEKALNAALRKRGIKLPASVRKAVLNALSERDEAAAICRDQRSHPEPDTWLRDYERVPLAEGVDEYFAREVLPHVPDAWIDQGTRDHKDGDVGKVGYEINFNRYFYQYQPPRPLAEIESDLKAIEAEIATLLAEVVP